MTDDVQQNNQNSFTAPGKALRDAREARRLSQAEVASRLRLSVQTIKDIEADNYANFSAPIYVRGYLRNYSAFLGIESEPLLQAFDEMGFSDEIKRHPSSVSYVSSGIAKTVNLHRSRSQLARRASWVIIGLFIALVVIWWYGQHHHKHATIAASLLPATGTSPSINTTPVAIPMTVVKPESDTKQ